jgi:hypothetical protein
VQAGHGGPCHFLNARRDRLGGAGGASAERGRLFAFFDHDDDGILAGEEWDKRLKQELAAAKCCVVL